MRDRDALPAAVSGGKSSRSQALQELLDPGCRVAYKGHIGGEGPGGVARLDVDLDQRLTVRIEQVGILASRVGESKSRTEGQAEIRVAQHRVRRFETEGAKQPEGKRMRLRENAFA